ncbi:hypothetical protein LQ318_02190 [Aliifodinibius salicampi]|uniref:Uncharacterized protein n=1 Tax=Fodinibius salicampi TaxID=1920655 RepID=A0ABT3PV20_9BACT|nr:hypothetical protein [Fodinibius salicampi]MCW9711702.1 hypothetical protein [Fodinibius salicampi]
MTFKKWIKYVLSTLLVLVVTLPAFGQFDEFNNVNPGFIKITNTGQLADTLSLWGDVGRSGRYIIPQGTTALELISYGGGFGGTRLNGNNSAFARIQMRVSISRFNEQLNREEVDHFSFRHGDPVPQGLRTYQLSSEDVVTLQVKRKPSFIDVLGVVGPILSTITTSYFIYTEIIK